MQTAYPLPQTPATVSRWARMARLFCPPCVVGKPTLNSYGAAISGLTVTIGRGLTGVAEAWVRTFFHVLDADDWSVTVPTNTAAQPRVDRIVLRWDPEIEDVTLEHVQGAPAANPVAQPLEQTDTGIWELPLWRFTVPANSGAPLTGLVDDRRWIDPLTGQAGPSGVTTAAVTASTPYDLPALRFDITPGTYALEALLVSGAATPDSLPATAAITARLGARPTVEADPVLFTAVLEATGTFYTGGAFSRSNIHRTIDTGATPVTSASMTGIEASPAGSVVTRITGSVNVTKGGPFGLSAVGSPDNWTQLFGPGSYLRLTPIG